MNWDDIRFFLAVSRGGSLAAAAEELDVSPTTAGRRLVALEKALAVQLLHKTPEGYVLTRAGRHVHEQAERAEGAVLGVSRVAASHEDKLGGLVRLTCAEMVASHMLAPCLVGLQQEHPDLSIQLIPSARELSLSMREADIAIRLSRPQQNELFVRRIGLIEFGLYASRSYLDEHGMPDFDQGCEGHRTMILIDDVQDADHVSWVQTLAPRARPGLQTNSHGTLFEATLAGGGLACLSLFRAEQEPELVRIPAPYHPPPTEIFLVVHKDSRSTPRIRLVLDAVTQNVRSIMSQFANPADREKKEQKS